MSTLPIHPPAPVLNRVREATAATHERLERRIPLTSPTLTHAAYAAVLEAYLGFHEPLEQQLAEVAGSINGLEWKRRIKTPALHADLRRLGRSEDEIAALPRCGRLPPTDTAEQALGCLYVLEGSTLGGQVLKRLISGRLGIDAHNGGAYLDLYGSETGPLWKQFLRCLSAIDEPAAIEHTAAAAADTFRLFESWLAEREVLRDTPCTAPTAGPATGATT